MFVFLSLSMMILASVPLYSFAQARVNWLETCEHPIGDALIMDPCYTMNSPDGYSGKGFCICMWLNPKAERA
jgi:hypothetical protein